MLSRGVISVRANARLRGDVAHGVVRHRPRVGARGARQAIQVIVVEPFSEPEIEVLALREVASQVPRVTEVLQRRAATGAGLNVVEHAHSHIEPTHGSYAVAERLVDHVVPGIYCIDLPEDS